MYWRDCPPTAKQTAAINNINKCLKWDCKMPKTSGDASILIGSMQKALEELIYKQRLDKLKELKNSDCNYVGSKYCDPVSSDTSSDTDKTDSEDGQIEDGDWLEEEDLPDEETEW